MTNKELDEQIRKLAKEANKELERLRKSGQWELSSVAQRKWTHYLQTSSVATLKQEFRQYIKGPKTEKQYALLNLETFLQSVNNGTLSNENISKNTQNIAERYNISINDVKTLFNFVKEYSLDQYGMDSDVLYSTVSDVISQNDNDILDDFANTIFEIYQANLQSGISDDIEDAIYAASNEFL